MSNHSYMISEGSLYKRKDEKGTKIFVEGSGLALDEDFGYSVPTSDSIERGLGEFGLNYEIHKRGKLAYEILASDSLNRKLWIEFTSEDNVEELVLIEIGGGSDQDLAIDFFRFMSKYHGRFIYYCDSGIMSLITYEKSNDQILEEMHMATRK